MPSLCLFFRRLRHKQQANNIAARARRARGIPTPSPIFCSLLKPALLERGARGSAEELELGLELERVAEEAVEEASEFRLDESDVTLLSVLLADPVDDGRVDMLADPEGVGVERSEFEGESVAVAVA